MPVKYLMYLLAGINTKCFLNVPKEKYFAPLRMLNLFIKSFVNFFVALALTFDSSFNSFLFDLTSFLGNKQYHFCLLNLFL